MQTGPLLLGDGIIVGLELGRGVSSPKYIEEASNERVHTTNISVQSGGHTGTKHKEGKVIMESLECSNLVFGVNIHINSVMAVSESILVGRARGKFFTAEYILY